MKAVLVIALFCVAALSLQGCGCDKAEHDKMMACTSSTSSDCDGQKKAGDCMKSSPCWNTADKDQPGSTCTPGQLKHEGKDVCDLTLKEKCEMMLQLGMAGSGGCDLTC
eukprot:gb/GFBE01030458.1/.p1 GENE.gb/GFBE01030458.1/~~gb/GFBE01030458.1/.p1  ORF type:complete len:109 (+),score=19.61 gb/GFBE01030458.1/:1-327(+)